jgi:hypothetical protein
VPAGPCSAAGSLRIHGLLIRRCLKLEKVLLHIACVKAFSQELDVHLCEELRDLSWGHAILKQTQVQEGSELCDDARLFILFILVEAAAEAFAFLCP